ncbi:MAG TPA: thiamine phosphate synthase [Nitrospiria bacterium]
MKQRRLSGLYLIIDQDQLRNRLPEKVTAEALEAGVRNIQYRAKGLSKREAYEAAVRIRDVCHGKDAVFIINDRTDLALAVNADGVHLGQEDLPVDKARKILGPGSVIGVSVHTVMQAQEAEKTGADYLGVGPVFPSQTKQARPPLGCTFLREIRKSVNIPVAAIGGIKPGNVRDVLESGAEAYAVVSAVLSADDIAVAVTAFQAAGKK